MLNTAFQIECIGLSDIGRIRDHNEDFWVADSNLGLFLLADGMGGHAGGEVAAREAVDDFLDLMKAWNPTKQTTAEQAIAFFREALDQINTRIYQQGQAEESLAGMGTTICVLYLLRSYAILAHIGDSRIYRFRHQRLDQLTEDHSLVSELISLGAMKPEDANTFAYKHILTRAVGTQPKIESTINYVAIESNDVYLICSDGLTNFVSDAEISQILTNENSLQMQAQQLINLANEHGGGDNISVILVKVV